MRPLSVVYSWREGEGGRGGGLEKAEIKSRELRKKANDQLQCFDKIYLPYKSTSMLASAETSSTRQRSLFPFIPCQIFPNISKIVKLW